MGYGREVGGAMNIGDAIRKLADDRISGVVCNRCGNPAELEPTVEDYTAEDDAGWCSWECRDIANAERAGESSWELQTDR